MISFFADIFGYILNFIYNLVGNYGLAIIIFSILVKLLMIPISIKQQKTMKKSSKMQEKMKEIQKKYKDNPEKLNAATMELYKSENMSPFSGCLSAIVQIVLLFSVFFLVKSPLTYMKKVDVNIIDKYTKIMKQNDLTTNSGYPEIELIRELGNIRKLRESENSEKVEENAKNKSVENTSEENNVNNENIEEATNTEKTENNEEKIALSEIKDEELDLLDVNMNFIGLNLAQVPTKTSDWKAYIIPIVYVIVSIISLKITTTMNTQKSESSSENKVEKKEGEEEEFDPMAQMNKNMNFMFPILYLAVALVAPLGLALYWLMNSLLMIVERLALNKFLKDEEE